jgi:putative ABC transport system permease protein
VVANLPYLQNNLALEPYQIWIKKREGATDQTVYDAIAAEELKIDAIESASQNIIKARNDPMNQGINGALTLGFIMIMLVCTLGFLIYWILSIRSRILQFGIFRAMGLTQRNVLEIIIWEQLLISGIAIVAGICIGGITSDYFVPLLQLVYSKAEQVPPFRVVAFREDYLRIYAVVGAMLCVGIFILRTFIGHLKIDQALKLGED